MTNRDRSGRPGTGSDKGTAAVKYCALGMEQIKAMQVIRRKSFLGTILLTGVTLALAGVRTPQYRSTVMEVAPSRGATERGFHADRSWRRWKAATRVWLPQRQLQTSHYDWFYDYGVGKRYRKWRLPTGFSSSWRVSSPTVTVFIAYRPLWRKQRFSAIISGHRGG